MLTATGCKAPPRPRGTGRAPLVGNGKALTVRGRAELPDTLRDVMEPESVFAASGHLRALGPTQAPMTVEAVATHAEAGAPRWAAPWWGEVDGTPLERARTVYRASTADYSPSVRPTRGGASPARPGAPGVPGTR